MSVIRSYLQSAETHNVKANTLYTDAVSHLLESADLKKLEQANMHRKKAGEYHELFLENVFEFCTEVIARSKKATATAAKALAVAKRCEQMQESMMVRCWGLNGGGEEVARVDSVLLESNVFHVFDFDNRIRHSLQNLFYRPGCDRERFNGEDVVVITVRDLASKTRTELRNCRNMGNLSIAKIESELASRGLKVGDYAPIPGVP